MNVLKKYKPKNIGDFDFDESYKANLQKFIHNDFMNIVIADSWLAAGARRPRRFLRRVPAAVVSSVALAAPSPPPPMADPDSPISLDVSSSSPASIRDA